MLTPPWQLVYADGSANVYRISSDGPFVYDPVTREQSSTGMYDGGPPRAGTVPEATLVEIARQVLALEAGARPDEPRAKGTGAFEITTPEGERQFIAARGPALAAFDQLLAGLK